jgi:hypothetical protein
MLRSPPVDLGRGTHGDEVGGGGQVGHVPARTGDASLIIVAKFGMQLYGAVRA